MGIRRAVIVVGCLALLAVGCGESSAMEMTGGGGDVNSRVEDYLTSSEFERLVLEVDATTNRGPRDSSVEWLVDKVDKVTDKPRGVNVVRDESIPARGEDHVWTFEALQQLVRDRRNLQLGEKSIKMYVLFIDGRFAADSDDRRILGVAWNRRNIAIFADALRFACQAPLPPRLVDRLCKYAEQSVWLHEVGHLLGLVNHGAPLTVDHHDEEHGPHCTNQRCVMYWMYAGPRLAEILNGNMRDSDTGPFDFGPDCLSDLEAVRSGSKKRSPSWAPDPFAGPEHPHP